MLEEKRHTAGQLIESCIYPKFAGMTIREANKQLLFQLYHAYDQSEAANITDLVMENITGWRRIDRVTNNTVRLSHPQEQLLAKYTEELSAHKPVQYVLHEAWFYGMKFYVDENVLIPRPETEELVEWIVKDNANRATSILDVGTGSGCIAVALKKKLPFATVYACDVSGPALQVARKNAEANGVHINFLHADILDKEQQKELPASDIIVSNPPYIPASEENTMNKNVTAHEPHLALFVQDNDPLIFYKALSQLPAKTFYFETHENLAQQVAAIFPSATIKNDMQGKERMVRSNNS